MQPALEALGGGASLGDALYATNFFDSTIKSILMAGERTGSANAVTSALKYIEDKKTASRAYLMVVFASLMELSTSLTIPPTIDDFLIPWLREHMPKATPEQMQMFSSQLDTLEFNNKIWMYFGDGSVFALGVLWAFWFFDAKARDWITNKILIKVPVLSEWYTADALSRSSGIFSSMIEGGVLIGDAMNTLLKTTDNPIAKTFWGSAKLAIERGASTEKAFGASGLLRKDELLVLAACKGNKQIAKAFKSISEERAWRKKILGARLFKLSIIGMFLHIGITLIIGFRLFGIFNAGLDVNMNNMTQGI